MIPATIHAWCGRLDDPDRGVPCPCRAWEQANQAGAASAGLLASPPPPVPRPPVRARTPRPTPGEVPPLPVLTVEQRRAAFARIVDVICTVEADNHRGAA